MYLKEALALILQPGMTALGQQVSPPVNIPVTLGYATITVDRPAVFLVREKGEPQFYVGEEAGPYEAVGAPIWQPPNLTEVLLKETIRCELQTDDNMLLLEDMYGTFIATLVGQLSNLDAAGFKLPQFEVGEEMMVPVDAERSRWYYMVPIMVTATTLVHPLEALDPQAPLPSITGITIDTTVTPGQLTRTSVLS